MHSVILRHRAFRAFSKRKIYFPQEASLLFKRQCLFFWGHTSEEEIEIHESVHRLFQGHL